jgi:hypothetical protein
MISMHAVSVHKDEIGSFCQKQNGKTEKETKNGTAGAVEVELFVSSGGEARPTTMPTTTKAPKAAHL